MAGDECRSTRSLTYQWSCASAQPCRNTHLSRGMPSSRAMATLVITTAADWSM